MGGSDRDEPAVMRRRLALHLEVTVGSRQVPVDVRVVRVGLERSPVIGDGFQVLLLVLPDVAQQVQGPGVVGVDLEGPLPAPDGVTLASVTVVNETEVHVGP